MQFVEASSFAATVGKVCQSLSAAFIDLNDVAVVCSESNSVQFVEVSSFAVDSW